MNYWPSRFDSTRVAERFPISKAHVSGIREKVQITKPDQVLWSPVDPHIVGCGIHIKEVSHGGYTKELSGALTTRFFGKLLTSVRLSMIHKLSWRTNGGHRGLRTRLLNHHAKMDITLSELEFWTPEKTCSNELYIRSPHCKKKHVMCNCESRTGLIKFTKYYGQN